MTGDLEGIRNAAGYAILLRVSVYMTKNSLGCCPELEALRSSLYQTADERCLMALNLSLCWKAPNFSISTMQFNSLVLAGGAA